jgi:tryptophan-rich sensory protein
MKKQNLLRLIAAVVFCEAIGISGSVFTTPSIGTWYAALNKPAFILPNWVFAPVWTTLFALMGIALYLVWSNGLKEKKVKAAVRIFAAQFALNILWSFLFFSLRLPLLAFAEIILLWLAIAATIIKFYPISRKAGLLLFPYLAWVTIASALNYFVWLLN